MLNDISLTVREGEIVGLAGLVGSGRTELARAIAGADPIDGGKIIVDGKERRIRSPAHALSAGIAFLTEERKKDGLFMELRSPPTRPSPTSPPCPRAGSCDARSSATGRASCSSSLNVDPPHPGAKASSLSGGNQQKVLFARGLFRNPRILILDEPTRGVDVGARAAIHRLINDLAKRVPPC